MDRRDPVKNFSPAQTDKLKVEKSTLSTICTLYTNPDETMTMRQRKLDDLQRQDICNLYQTSSFTMEELAWRYYVHRRTIQRVLLDKGIINPRGMVSERDREILGAVQGWTRVRTKTESPTNQRLVDAVLIDCLRRIHGIAPNGPHQVLQEVAVG